MASTQSSQQQQLQQPRPQAPLKTLQLRMSCKNLPTHTDPNDRAQCVIVVSHEANGKWAEIGRSEPLKLISNIEFYRLIPIEYKFERVQKLRFVVAEVGKGKSTTDIGHIETTLSQLIKTNKYTEELISDRAGEVKVGSIGIIAKELTEWKTNVVMEFHGASLDRKDLLGFGKSDPYFLIYRLPATEGTADPVLVYRSEVVMSNLNPHWKPFEMLLGNLCGNARLETKLKIEVWDWDQKKSHDFIGDAETTLFEMQSSVGKQHQYLLQNSHKWRRTQYMSSSGYFHTIQCKLVKLHSFEDVIAGGTQIALTVAVNFSASNGDKGVHTSLHSLQTGQQNNYQSIIAALGTVLAPYSVDHVYPAFGFGARFPDGTTSHKFSLNGVPDNANCQGVEGILQAYAKAVENLTLDGPTQFAQVISEVASISSHHRDGGRYHVLAILTNEMNVDTNETIAALNAAASLPLSVVIINVGDSKIDFQALSNKPLPRNLLNLASVKDHPIMNEDATELVAAALNKIPEQVIDYMKLNNIAPVEPFPAEVLKH